MQYKRSFLYVLVLMITAMIVVPAAVCGQFIQHNPNQMFRSPYEIVLPQSYVCGIYDNGQWEQISKGDVSDKGVVIIATDYHLEKIGLEHYTGPCLNVRTDLKDVPVGTLCFLEWGDPYRTKGEPYKFMGFFWIQGGNFGVFQRVTIDRPIIAFRTFGVGKIYANVISAETGKSYAEQRNTPEENAVNDTKVEKKYVIQQNPNPNYRSPQVYVPRGYMYGRLTMDGKWIKVPKSDVKDGLEIVVITNDPKSLDIVHYTGECLFHEWTNMIIYPVGARCLLQWGDPNLKVIIYKGFHRIEDRNYAVFQMENGSVIAFMTFDGYIKAKVNRVD